jgi:hypothetical protein
MKKLLTLVCCIIVTCANAQQEKNNKFYIVDGVTNKPMIVSVAMVRAKLSITTEKDGIFIIPGNLAQMRDTIIFSAQNYADLKMSLRGLEGLDTLRLSKFTIEKMLADRKFTRDTLLNNFRDTDISFYAGLHTGANSFEYLQLAQQFYTDKPNTRLKNIKIKRLAFNISWGDRYAHTEYTQLEQTRFRIRIYDIDPKTGGPGKDLCNEIIEVRNNESTKERINLKDHNIIIPHQTFFVAIEWMRGYFNAHSATITDKKTGKRDLIISYKPSIGISPDIGKKINIWSLDTKHEWKPFTYFYPFGTDLAIKATVEY